ncbi:MAG: saccharopine dehydrogenase [bacterium]|nr:saccharopine dehydrogenase [bacterium]
MKIVVLGAGLVGGPMARDLAADERFDVTVADVSAPALAYLAGLAPVATVVADLSDPATVTSLVGEYDLVVGAMPGHLGYATLEAVIAAGRPVVDIAFFPEDPFALDEAARRAGVTAVVDCGVFPGMGSALIGRAARLCDRLDDVVIHVGGLPEVRQQPFEYRAVFSPVDVIEEYTRPARYRRDGLEVMTPALSEPELLDFPGVGTLEAFDTDGLRTLLTTIDAPNLRERTLRYPGHIEKMKLFRECGFFAEDPVETAGGPVVPRDLTAALLFPMWRLPEGEGDLTVLRIRVEGEQEGRPVGWTYDLLDRYDHDLGVTSMARTTGYTATMTVRALADGLYREPGITPPEYLGRVPGCVPYLLEGLAARGIVYRETRTGI